MEIQFISRRGGHEHIVVTLAAGPAQPTRQIRPTAASPEYYDNVGLSGAVRISVPVTIGSSFDDCAA